MALDLPGTLARDHGHADLRVLRGREIGGFWDALRADGGALRARGSVLGGAEPRGTYGRACGRAAAPTGRPTSDSRAVDLAKHSPAQPRRERDLRPGQPFGWRGGLGYMSTAGKEAVVRLRHEFADYCPAAARTARESILHASRLRDDFGLDGRILAPGHCWIDN